MASDTSKARYDVSSQVEDAIERGDWAEVARILSECSRRDSDSVMTQLVSRDQWDAVKQVIRCVGDEERTWDIEGVWVKNNILLSVAEGNWRDFGDMPHKRFLHSTLEWILQQACTRAKQTDIVQYVLPHCEDDQLDSALQQLVTHGLWFAAGRMLQRPVSDERVRWVIQQACQRAEGMVLGAYVIPFCPTSTLDFLLTEVVSRDMWQAAGRVLMRGVSDTRHCWALKEACCRAEGWQVKRFILPLCTQGHCNSVLTDFVTESQWSFVDKLLKYVLNVALKVRADGMHINSHCVQLASSRNYVGIFTLLETCQTDSQEVHRMCDEIPKDNGIVYQAYLRSWDVLKPVQMNRIREEGFQLLTDVFAVIRVIATIGHNAAIIIPKCDGHQLKAIESQCWDKYVNNRLSQESASDPRNVLDMWTVYMLDVNPTTSQTTETSTCESTGEHLAKVLRRMFTQDVWWTLGKVLEQGLDDNSVKLILKQTLLHDDDQMIVEHVLPHCTDSQTDLAVTELVSAGQWESVTKLVQLVGDRKQTWTVGGTSVDTTLLHLVAGGRWGEVGDMLQRGVDDAQFTLSTDTAMLRADDDAFAEHILPFLIDRSGKNCDSTVATMISKGRWISVEKILLLDGKQMWTVDDISIDRKTLHHMAGGRWQEVGIMLTQGVGDSLHRWMMYTASSHANSTDLITYILPHCADDHLECVLRALAKRSMWQAVNDLFKQGAIDKQRLVAVNKACELYTEMDIMQYVLPHCADDSVDTVLTTLVGRSLWRAARVMLERRVSDVVKHWVVEKACEHCNKSDADETLDECVKDIILPHCADDQLDSVLTTLVERRLWWAVADVLKRNVSDACKQSAVLKACTLYENDENDDSCSWYSSDDDSDDDGWYYQWVVDENIRVATNTFIIDKILPHCADSNLDSVSKALADRGLWRAVGEVLKRCITDCKTTEQKTCEHCNSAELYFNNYSVATADSSIERTTTSHCTDDNLDPLSPEPIRQDVCMAVRNVGGTEVSDAERRANIQTAFQYADTYSLVYNILPYYVYDSIHSALKMLASRQCLSASIELLHYCCIDTLSTWAQGKDTASKDELFWGIVKHSFDGVQELTPAIWRSVTWSKLQRSLKQLLDWDTPLCEVLCESLLAIVREIWLSGREQEIDGPEHSIANSALSTVEQLHQQIATVLMECKTYHTLDVLSCTEGLQHGYSERKSRNCFLFQLYFIKNLVHQTYKRKAWTQMIDAILVVLTTLPVAPDVQSVALKVMLRHNRWDVIKHACLSGVCEQDRRQLFQAAVKQRQWSAVKRWADHTLYDDQRLWALGEARQEKRWDVYLKLADHGLSEWERVGVLFRVAMHADWKLVRHMLRTVADVTDMIDLLTNTPGTLAKLGETQYKQRMNQLGSFEKTLMKDTNTLKTLKTMAKRRKWWVALHNIRHKPNLQHARLALKAAVSSEAWQAVMQLVKLETDVTRRDSLFRDMVRLRQWAVCRELLEQCVSHQLCLELLSELIEHSQWTLVAMVMECPKNDESRKKIMHQAMMMSEGSVVWECINNMQTRLSVEERQEMFQLVFNREVWQAVKPLVEIKDDTGIRHRDTALLEAIEQHQWDVVDHCQRHHADINMKDYNGRTPIHRAAKKKDWEAVKELTVRDGDPNLLDSDGLSVLHRATRAEQWDAVKLLIQFHGDIHQSVPNYEDDTETPLKKLIDARQGEVIESTLMWCPDQQKGVNEEGETTLHAVCLSGWPNILRYLIARKVNPLALTGSGYTPLCYAVLCEDCPHTMVAECITLGLTTHQPQTTDLYPWVHRYLGCSVLGGFDEELLFLRSPLVLAMMRGLPVVTQMLCESGACSNRQLFKMKAYLARLTVNPSSARYQLNDNFNTLFKNVNGYEAHSFCNVYPFDEKLIEQSIVYLREMCSTPRSLVSTCRLVISRCLTLSKTRHGDIAQLPLSPTMKNYLMFTDLTDPRYPDLSYRS